MSKTIIVSNRLPVRMFEQDGQLRFKPSEGGLATGLGSIYKEGDNIWIGWPGKAIEEDTIRTQVENELKNESMKPVFLTDREIEEYYEGFSNETLWPNFHYFNQYIVFEDKHWQTYIGVNQKFADSIIDSADEEDTIWIHDYQLLLVPEMVRTARPKASIGFFLHIPFPSYESFRLLPWRRQLLNGMLGSDFLGFHTYDDMRHFLSSVNRLAGIGNSNGIIKVNGRMVMVDALPMGIDYDKYADSASSPETLEREVRYRTSIGEEKLLLSIDRLDYSKGIPQRLEAFELFLERNPDYLERVSIIMIVVPSRDQVDMYRHLKEEIDLLVGRINGKYSRINWTPVHYFYRSFPLPDLSAYYRMAHVAMVTPMRDGMNLVCKEFIASKINKRGVLILSEMAGASKELSDSILVNPNDIEHMTESIRQALEMPVQEQERRLESMQKSLRRYNIHHWVNLFMDRLNYVKKEQKALETEVLEKNALQKLLDNYRKSQNRLLFLDYDGTLVGFKSDPLEATPDEELMTILDNLIQQKSNRVSIITGRSHHTMEQWFGHMNLDIIAEHGVWFKEQGTEWQTHENLSAEWKKNISEVLEGYVSRTPGSFIEEKDYSLVWHYRKVETGLGEIRTRELTSHLKYLTTNQNLQVLEGDMVVEIKNSEINKGRGALTWLGKFKPDFVLSVGDDWTDEDMFKALPDDSFTIKVGSNTSQAKYRLSSFNEVRKLLKNLGS